MSIAHLQGQGLVSSRPVVRRTAEGLVTNPASTDLGGPEEACLRLDKPVRQTAESGGMRAAEDTFLRQKWAS